MKRYNNLQNGFESLNLDSEGLALANMVAGYNRVLGIGLAVAQVAQEMELSFNEVALHWNYCMDAIMDEDDKTSHCQIGGSFPAQRFVSSKNYEIPTFQELYFRGRPQGWQGPLEHPDICRNCGKLGQDWDDEDTKYCQCPPMSWCTDCEKLVLITEGRSGHSELGTYQYEKYECGHEWMDVDLYPASHFA